MTLKIMKHLFAIVLYCLSEKQGLCGSPNVYERYMNISKMDHFGHILSDKIVLVGEKFFDNRTVVNMIFPIEQNSFMVEVMKKTNLKMNSFWTMYTKGTGDLRINFDYDNPLAMWQKPDVYITPLHQKDYFDRFEARLEQLKKQPHFNTRAAFVFLDITHECGQYNKSNDWVPIFSKLWKHNCLLMVGLVLSTCDFQLTIVTAKPFSSENRCRSPSTHGVKCHTFATETDDIHFSKEGPSYFNGCSFLIAAAHYPPYTIANKIQKSDDKTVLDFVGGLEMELVRLLSTKLGFTFEIDQSEEYNVVGCLSQHGIEQSKIEFCFGGMTPDYKSAFIHEIPFTYMVSPLTWFVADASIASQWKIIFSAFSLYVWIGLFCTNLIFIIIYNTFEKYDRNRVQRLKNSLELFRSFLGISSTLKPQTLHLKVLYLSWSLFSMNMTLAFSSILFELMRNPPVKREIRTIQDLKDSGYQTAAHTMYFNMFRNSTLDNTIRYILKNRVLCYSMQDCYEKLFRWRNFCILDREEHVRYLVDLKKMKIHKIDQNMITLGISILISKGSPLSMHMTKIIIQAFQAGLIKQWEKETGRRFRAKFDFDIPTEVNISPISFHNLQTAFLLLTIGLAVSILVFIVEILSQFIKKFILYLYSK